MRKINTKVGSHNLIKEDFESYNELLKVTSQRPYNSWADHKYRNDPDSRHSWAGNISFNKAKKYLVEGWKDKEQEIKDKLSKFNIEGKSKANLTMLDVAGYSPCVPNYIMGLPLTMYNSYQDIKKSKVIDIIYDVDFSAGEDNEDIIRKGVDLLARINSLEMNGYRVKLSAVANFAHGYDDNWYMCTVPVKNEHQPLNIPRVAFPIAHPAMLRQIMFEWYETLPGAQKNSGYGASVHHWNSNERKLYLDHFTESHQVYLNYYSDLDRVFNSLEKNKGQYKGER